ncbi:MAG: hypothetical protein GXP42_10760 [Chloroflexi bacterium]|nr:hypothetical protein [Chloroflexota bacterium]
MSEPLRIFVSATADLEAERAVIGKTVAELPIQLRTEIRRYPREGTSYETLFELIANVDRVYFLLGGDITAPSGSEWDLAMQLERPLLALRKPGPLTPAAREFLRNTSFQVAAQEWRFFRSDAELARIIALDLADMLLHPLNRYGLSVADMEAVSVWRKRWQAAAPDEPSSDEPGGAEGSAVILGKS